MIAIHYFASIREALGKEHEEFSLPNDVNTVGQLIDHLVDKRGNPWGEVLNDKALMIAVNHEMGNRSVAISGGDEIAFFPPVTGG